jgi:hypothetical protein
MFSAQLVTLQKIEEVDRTDDALEAQVSSSLVYFSKIK